MENFMGQSPDVFYANAIRERRDFSSYANSMEDVYTQLMSAYTRLTGRWMPVYWLGGSRSWDALVRSIPSASPLPLEADAIIPGNYDTFLLCNNTPADIYKQLVSTMEQVVRALVDQNNQSPNTQYLLEIQTRNFNKTTWNESPGQCTLFKCHSIFVNVVGHCGRSTRGGQAVPEFKDKLLFYFEFGRVTNVNIDLFKSVCLTARNVPTLTLTGHLLFNEFLAQARLEKGLNVDRLRTDLLRRIVNKTETDPVSVYLQLSNTYAEMFGEATAYGKPYYDKYIVERYAELILDNIHAHAYDEIDAYVIERLRPVLNRFLLGVSQRVFPKMYEPKTDAVMFLAGGDAVRRYLDKNNRPIETITKDLDVKIYYDATMRQETIARAAETQIAPELVALAGYLNQHKDEFFIPTRSYNLYGYTAYIQFVVPSNQFRVRYFEATEALPVYLLSLDYRMYVQITVGTRTFSLRHDLAILDLVLDKNPYSSLNALRKVLYAIPDFIPIPSIRFLLKDLESTYTQRSRAAARFWSGKNDKDAKRYTFLKELELDDPNIDASLNVVSDQIVPGDNRDDDIAYRMNLFRDIIVKNHKSHRVRHKMPFIYDEDDDEDEEK